MKDLTEKEIKELTYKASIYMLKNRTTIRTTADIYEIPKSNLHTYIHKYLPDQDKFLYRKLSKMLKANFEHKNNSYHVNPLSRLYLRFRLLFK